MDDMTARLWVLVIAAHLVAISVGLWWRDARRCRLGIHCWVRVRCGPNHWRLCHYCGAEEA